MAELKKNLILFPHDPSTLFLQEIVSYIYNNVHTSIFDFIKIEPNDNAHKSALEAIKKSNYETIIFFGHGTSVSLYGAFEEQYKNDKFITSSNSELFKGKKLIFVSCESSSFIKRIKKVEYIEAIGFGDLPTDWNDVQAARELDSNAYKGFSEDNIESFKKSLIEIIKFSLSEFLTDSKSMKELYHILQLRINKRIVKYYLEDKIKNKPLSDSLFNMKQELLFIHY